MGENFTNEWKLSLLWRLCREREAHRNHTKWDWLERPGKEKEKSCDDDDDNTSPLYEPTSISFCLILNGGRALEKERERDKQQKQQQTTMTGDGGTAKEGGYWTGFLF